MFDVNWYSMVTNTYLRLKDSDFRGKETKKHAQVSLHEQISERAPSSIIIVNLTSRQPKSIVL